MIAAMIYSLDMHLTPIFCCGANDVAYANQTLSPKSDEAVVRTKYRAASFYGDDTI